MFDNLHTFMYDIYLPYYCMYIMMAVSRFVRFEDNDEISPK